MPETDIGKGKHYFDKIGVAVIELTADLKVNDKIRIEAELPFVQTVESMQIDHKDIEHAKAGDDIGMKTLKPCNDGDRIIKIEF